MKKQIHLAGFAGSTPATLSFGLWKHPNDQGHRHNDLSYWIEMAEILERGKFDALFIADTYSPYSVYKGSYKPSFQYAAVGPAPDPFIAISAMAHATSRLGIACTSSTSYIHPYYLARQLSTLDHQTKGRIGWNIVTSYAESEAKNLGSGEVIPHDERYDRADEYMDVVYKLWEQSWEDGAVVNDRETDTYVDPEKVHLINHAGKYFNVAGPHYVNPSVQRTPVLFQAGGSSRGREFAAKHAEAIFTVATSVNAVRDFAQDIRERVKRYGRKGDHIKILPLMLPIVGSTEEEAKAKQKDYEQYSSVEGVLTLLSGQLGVDLSKYDPDQYVSDIKGWDGLHHIFEMFANDREKKWTIREALQSRGLGTDAALFVGTPEQIADQMELWMNEGDIDGFVLAQAITPGTFRDFVDEVVPELQRRGIYRKEYEGETLREHLLGKGNMQLLKEHPGKQVSISEPIK